jgi:DNA modification methylase
LSLGIQSEIGRGDGLFFGKCLPPGFDEEKYGKKQSQSTSIFDPVLCEICYKWFCPEDGRILDPFSGGSVRGVIAASLGYKYTGIDMSEIQIKANIEQMKKIVPDANAEYIVGDSNVVLDGVNESYDLLFSCPPYHDLEVYSEESGDLSNMSYEEFLIAYDSIIKKSLAKLKDNRFAIFVVGDVRDAKGFYKNFVEDTVKIFEKHGAKKYNEIIFLKPLNTLPIRTSVQFPILRKVGKAHENVLVFFKGDIEKVREDFKPLNLYTMKQVDMAGFF